MKNKLIGSAGLLLSVVALIAAWMMVTAKSANAEDTDQTNTIKPQWIQNGLYLGTGAAGTSTPNGTATSANPLVVFGTETHTGATINNGDLTVNGDAGIGGKTLLTGAVVASSTLTSGDLTVNGDAGVAGKTLLHVVTSGDLNVNGDAGVAGNALITGNLTASAGAVFSSSASVAGALTASSALNRGNITMPSGTATVAITSGSLCVCSLTSACAGDAGINSHGMSCSTSASTLSITLSCNDAGVAYICL